MSTDATTKILGFEYQKMVALKKCLEAKPHGDIYLECFGDISDGSTSVETKHSIYNKSLHNTHIDFWKTLGNLIDKQETLKDYSKYIIHTTAKIDVTSIFSEWSSLSAKEKERKVRSIASNNTISKHHAKMTACTSNTLQNILNKLHIEDEQKDSKEYYINILRNGNIIPKITTEGSRDAVINALLGYITAQIIFSKDNNYIWHINIDEFNINFQSIIKRYLIEDLIFPVFSIDPDLIEDKGYRFTKKIRDINYENMVGVALRDYINACKSQILMITSRASLSDDLDNFDKEIAEDLNDWRIQYNDKITRLTNSNLEIESKEFYDFCLKSVESRLDIQGVTRLNRYYPKGRIHHNVEHNDEFIWNLKSDI